MVSRSVLLGFPGGSDGKESAYSAGDQVQSLGWEDPLEKGMTYPLQYSCLENSMSRGAWQATVHEVTESDMNGHTLCKVGTKQILELVLQATY